MPVSASVKIATTEQNFLKGKERKEKENYNMSDKNK
jgi:hypothetical protein